MKIRLSFTIKAYFISKQLKISLNILKLLHRH
nr:MAG TPA: hypothetical protein [Caudoviricetes sp.]